MKYFNIIFGLILLTITGAFSQEPTNVELFEMYKRLESKIDIVVKEANEAKAELALTKKRLSLANKELEKLKNQNTNTTQILLSSDEHKNSIKTKKIFSAYIEPLYIRPSRGDLDYVVVDQNGEGPDDIVGSVKSVEPSAKTAFRLGLAYPLDYDKDVFVGMTRITNKANDSITRPAGGALWGNWLHANSIIDDDNVIDASANFEIKHTVFDVGVKKDISFGKTLNSNLFGGVRYANNNQDFNIQYLQTGTNREVNTNLSNTFKGFGPRVGIDIDWEFSKNISLFGSLSTSLLMGDFKLHQTAIETADGVNYNTKVDWQETWKNRLIPVMEFKVGLGYQHNINSNILLKTYLGYELQNWSNMVSSRRFNDDVDSQLSAVSDSDLTFDGFFLRGELIFK